MDLAAIVDDEFIQPLRGAIVAEDMVATRQLIDSLTMESEKTPDKDTVRVYAQSYILELRDGEQYKSPPTIEDIEIWIDAKGLSGILEPYAVLANIRTEGTTWDQKGGSLLLKEIISEENIKRITDIAVEQKKQELINFRWL
jgi:hypothetical protein